MDKLYREYNIPPVEGSYIRKDTIISISSLDNISQNLKTHLKHPKFNEDEEYKNLFVLALNKSYIIGFSKDFSDLYIDFDVIEYFHEKHDITNINMPSEFIFVTKKDMIMIIFDIESLYYDEFMNFIKKEDNIIFEFLYINYVALDCNKKENDERFQYFYERIYI